MQHLRTGAAYRAAIADGRKVWVVGAGEVTDVATHPATRAMVAEYVAWYDRHFDAAWQDRVLSPADSNGVRLPWGFVLPRSADDLVAMGRCFSATIFLSAGNITHTPAYGQLIALGILALVEERNVSAEQIANARAYRDLIARTGRFLTFAAGSAPIGFRMRADPADRAALRLVRETTEGLVVSGMIGMHTSPAYAEDVYIGGHNGVDWGGHRASFVVPVNAPGVRIVCRRPSARDEADFAAPLSRRYDELDGQMWLDDVLVPWNRIFLVEPSPDPVARWLFWHQLYCWLAKAEFTLGLGLACTHAMGLLSDDATVGYLVDLIVDVQTVRSCLAAAERDPKFTASGYAYPNHAHIAAGSIAMLKARPHMSEILRILPGSSLVVAPTDRDLADPGMAPGFAAAFGGGGYTAAQRAALLNLAWDHVASALESRESVYELHANGGIPIWRQRLRRCFEDYNSLANAVMKQIDIAMPAIDVGALPAAPMVPRRTPTVTPPTNASPTTNSPRQTS